MNPNYMNPNYMNPNICIVKVINIISFMQSTL